jgi:predicted phosphoribosyltransferase
MKHMLFQNRQEAGRALADRLMPLAGRNDVALFALPRGGVAVGAEIARALQLPLDVLIVRKIGAPGHEEFAIGALTETGDAVWNDVAFAFCEYDPQRIGEIIEREQAELRRRVRLYRSGRELPSLAGLTAVLIDDGIATGLTMLAAVLVAERCRASRVVIAVPHGAAESIDALRRAVDGVVVLEQPEPYGSVGQFYREYPQTTDEEVLGLLRTYGPGAWISASATYRS